MLNSNHIIEFQKQKHDEKLRQSFNLVTVMLFHFCNRRDSRCHDIENPNGRHYCSLKPSVSRDKNYYYYYEYYYKSSFSLCSCSNS